MEDLKEGTETGLQATTPGAAYVATTGNRITGGKATDEEIEQAKEDAALGVLPLPVGAVKLLKKAPIHHLATAKNRISKVRGGPWTPRFEAIFKKAGMTLEDAANKVPVPGHYGPHPEELHRTVFKRLSDATEGLAGEEYAKALQEELRVIGDEVATPGSILNRLVTGT